MQEQDKQTQSEAGRVIWSAQGESNRGTCWFCEYNVEPDYKDIEVLNSFLSPRGKILARRITNTCAGHQRALGSSIKLAREMALLR